MQQTLAWRAMHSIEDLLPRAGPQGRALFSLLIRYRGPEVERATIREAEFTCNSLIGFNFGDGHLHDQKMIQAVQKRCRFEPGELVVAWIESQPVPCTAMSRSTSSSTRHSRSSNGAPTGWPTPCGPSPGCPTHRSRSSTARTVGSGAQG